MRLFADTLFDCDMLSEPSVPGRLDTPVILRSLACCSDHRHVGGRSTARCQTRPGHASAGVGTGQKAIASPLFNPCTLAPDIIRYQNRGQHASVTAQDAAFEQLLLLQRAARSSERLACVRGSCKSLETDRYPALACHEPECKRRHNTADLDRSPVVSFSLPKKRTLLDDRHHLLCFLQSTLAASLSASLTTGGLVCCRVPLQCHQRHPQTGHSCTRQPFSFRLLSCSSTTTVRLHGVCIAAHLDRLLDLLHRSSVKLSGPITDLALSSAAHKTRFHLVRRLLGIGLPGSA